MSTKSLQIAKTNCKIFQKIALETVEYYSKDAIVFNAISELKKIRTQSVLLESVKDAYNDLLELKSTSPKIQKLLRELQQLNTGE